MSMRWIRAGLVVAALLACAIFARRMFVAADHSIVTKPISILGTQAAAPQVEGIAYRNNKLLAYYDHLGGPAVYEVDFAASAISMASAPEPRGGQVQAISWRPGKHLIAATRKLVSVTIAGQAPSEPLPPLPHPALDIVSVADVDGAIEVFAVPEERKAPEDDHSREPVPESRTPQLAKWTGERWEVRPLLSAERIPLAAEACQLSTRIRVPPEDPEDCTIGRDEIYAVVRMTGGFHVHHTGKHWVIDLGDTMRQSASSETATILRVSTDATTPARWISDDAASVEAEVALQWPWLATNEAADGQEVQVQGWLYDRGIFRRSEVPGSLYLGNVVDLSAPIGVQGKATGPIQKIGSYSDSALLMNRGSGDRPVVVAGGTRHGALLHSDDPNWHWLWTGTEVARVDARTGRRSDQAGAVARLLAFCFATGAGGARVIDEGSVGSALVRATPVIVTVVPLALLVCLLVVVIVRRRNASDWRQTLEVPAWIIVAACASAFWGWFLANDVVARL